MNIFFCFFFQIADAIHSVSKMRGAIGFDLVVWSSHEIRIVSIKWLYFSWVPFIMRVCSNAADFWDMLGVSSWPLFDKWVPPEAPEVSYKALKRIRLV